MFDNDLYQETRHALLVCALDYLSVSLHTVLQKELNKAAIAKAVQSLEDREGNSGATHVQS